MFPDSIKRLPAIVHPLDIELPFEAAREQLIHLLLWLRAVIEHRVHRAANRQIHMIPVRQRAKRLHRVIAFRQLGIRLTAHKHLAKAPVVAVL